MAKAPTGLKRRKMLTIHFDEKEKGDLRRTATGIGVSMEEYIRAKCFGYPLPEKKRRAR